MKEKRGKRLESEFKKEIYDVLTKRIKNPYITEMFTITDVRVNDDLSESTVYVSVFSADEEKSERTFEAIRDSAQEVRSIISKQMHIRTVPKFNFVLDTSEEYGLKIDKIISTFTYGDHDDDK